MKYNNLGLCSVISYVGLDDQGSIPGRRRDIFLYTTASRTPLWPTKPGGKAVGTWIWPHTYM